MLDALAISDVHLGSDICQAKLLSQLLEKIHSKEIKTKYLIINGDLFDDSNFHRLKKSHWHVLSLIRKISDHIEVIHIKGNHELPTDLMSILLGVNVVDDYEITSNNKRIYFHHGHRYDEFIANHPRITWLADKIYWILQKIDPSFGLAKYAKHSSKNFLRNSGRIKQKSIEYAKKHGFDVVAAGHTHYPLIENEYCNSGSWTELPCTYITIQDGVIELHEIDGSN